MKDFTVINRDDKNKRYRLGTRKTPPELPPRNSFASLLFAVFIQTLAPH